MMLLLLLLLLLLIFPTKRVRVVASRRMEGRYFWPSPSSRKLHSFSFGATG
jgi:hypothetical protein